MGYVKNLKDGRVEAFVEGQEAAVKAFHEELLAGPNYSRVEEVEELVLEPNGAFSTFIIER